MISNYISGNKSISAGSNEIVENFVFPSHNSHTSCGKQHQDKSINYRKWLW